MQCRHALIRRDARASACLFYPAIQHIILMRGGVVVTKGDERTHLDPYSRSRFPQQPMLDDRRVLAVDHTHVLLHYNSADFKRKNGIWIQAKSLQMNKS